MEKLEGEGGDSRLCYSACLTHSRFNLSTTKEKSLEDLGLYFPFLTPGRTKGRTLQDTQDTEKRIASPPDTALGTEGFDLQYV